MSDSEFEKKWADAEHLREKLFAYISGISGEKLKYIELQYKLNGYNALGDADLKRASRSPKNAISFLFPRLFDDEVIGHMEAMAWRSVYWELPDTWIAPQEWLLRRI